MKSNRKSLKFVLFMLLIAYIPLLITACIGAYYLNDLGKITVIIIGIAVYFTAVSTWMLVDNDKLLWKSIEELEQAKEDMLRKGVAHALAASKLLKKIDELD